MPNRSLFGPWCRVCAYLFLFFICGNNAWGQAVVGYSLSGDLPIGKYHAVLWNNGVMQDLGTLPGHTNSVAYGINNACQVVGQSWGNERHAFLWSNGVMQDLGMLPGQSPDAAASGINNAGQVVGTSSGRAFLWSNGVMQDLGALPGGNSSNADGINDAGQVVGASQCCGNSLPDKHPFLWGNGMMQDLGTLPGSSREYGEAFAINSAGQAVGYSLDPVAGGEHAVLWSNGTIQDLGTLPGGQGGGAQAINNTGQVAGGANTFDSPSHAFLWSAGGGMQDLGTLPGGTSSAATGINNSGQVVGGAETFVAQVQAMRPHAFLWSNGVLQDLGVLPGHLSSYAYGIADIACGSFPSFSLSASPASQSVAQGGSTSYTVTIAPSGGFSNPVTFSVSGLPAGASGSFNPNPATTSSTLSVTTAASTPAGTYSLTITGTGGSLTHTTTATLMVNPSGVKFDNSTHTDYHWDVTSITTPEFLIGNSANRAAMIMIAMPENNAINITASLGGVKGTLVPGTDSGTTASMRTLIYQVINPAPGTQTATVSWDNAMAADIGVVLVSGADQTTPVTSGTFAATDSAPDAVTSLTVASNPGDLTASVAVNSNAWVSTNQTLIFLDSGSVGGDIGTGTGTTTHSWTGQFLGEVHSISAGNFKAF